VTTPFLFVAAAAVVLLIATPVVLMIAASRGGANLLRIVMAVAFLAIAVSAIWAISGVLAIVADSVSVTVPIDTMPVQVPAGVTLEGPLATISTGGFDRVHVTATGLSLAARVVLGAATVLSAATAFAVAVVVLRLARSTRDGNPFAVGPRALVITGWVTLVGGTVATWVGNIGDWLASRDLFGLNGWSGTNPDVLNLSELGWPDPAALRLDLPWAPVAIALVMAMLAGVFRYGERLRRDADGLV